MENMSDISAVLIGCIINALVYCAIAGVLHKMGESKLCATYREEVRLRGMIGSVVTLMGVGLLTLLSLAIYLL